MYSSLTLSYMNMLMTVGGAPEFMYFMSQVLT